MNLESIFTVSNTQKLKSSPYIPLKMFDLIGRRGLRILIVVYTWWTTWKTLWVNVMSVWIYIRYDYMKLCVCYEFILHYVYVIMTSYFALSYLFSEGSSEKKASSNVCSANHIVRSQWIESWNIVQGPGVCL